jgi:hypothetical protein
MLRHFRRLPDRLAQFEGVELFRRCSEVAELVDGGSHGRKRERGKRRSEQGVQIFDCADAEDSKQMSLRLSGTECFLTRTVAWSVGRGKRFHKS